LLLVQIVLHDCIGNQILSSA